MRMYTVLVYGAALCASRAHDDIIVITMMSSYTQDCMCVRPYPMCGRTDCHIHDCDCERS